MDVSASQRTVKFSRNISSIYPAQSGAKQLRRTYRQLGCGCEYKSNFGCSCSNCGNTQGTTGQGRGLGFLPFLAPLIAAISTAGTIAGSAVAIKQLAKTNPESAQKAVENITPQVIAELATKGIHLPTGQEQSYIMAALLGNPLPSTGFSVGKIDPTWAIPAAGGALLLLWSIRRK